MKPLRMKISTQIVLGIGTVIAVLLALSGVALWQTNRLATLAGMIVDHPVPVRDAIAHMQLDLISIADRHVAADRGSGRLTTEDVAFLTAQRRDIERQLAVLRDRYLGPEDDLRSLEQAIEQVNAAPGVVGARPTGDRAAFEAARHALGVVDDFAAASAAAFATEAAGLNAELNWQIIASSIALLGVCVGVGIVMLFSVRVPLHQLTTAAAALRAGRHDARVQYVGDNEFGLLAATFNAMADAVRDEFDMNAASLAHAGSGLFATDFVAGIWKSSDVLDQLLGIDAGYPRTVEGWLALVHPDDRAMMQAYLAEDVLRRGQVFNKRYRILRPRDGVVRWVHGLGFLTFDAKGTAVRMAGTIRDITERVEAEDSRRVQIAALNAAASPIVITDVSGAITWANAAFTTLTGYATDDVVGWNPRDLVKSGEQDRAFYAQMWETITSGHVWEGELINRRKDGSTYPERMTITPVHDSNGVITHFVAVKQDLTIERRRQAEWLQAQKLESVGRLAGGVAHDFNNLLTVILSYAKFVEEARLPDEACRDDVRQIITAGESAAALTSRLLAFSRKQVIQPTQVNMNEVVSEGEPMLRRLLGEDIQFDIHLAPIGGVIRADRGQLEQVLMNLVINARDAMPDGGRLTVATTTGPGAAPQETSHGAPAPPEVSLLVRDTGTGMDDATLARIFEPFFTTKAFNKGTGLGLSTVQEIVNQAGGHLNVQTRVGTGTTFTVSFPVIGAAPSVGTARVTTKAELKGTETVLVVEDAPPIRQSVRMALERNGYRVIEASDGVSALRASGAHAGPIDLLLTDVVMPVMGGRTLATRIREHRPGIKVLFVSGYTDDTISEHGILDPGVSLLHKPFTPEPLARKVREVLDGA